MIVYTYIIIFNNIARLQDPILLLKIPIGTPKIFSENYLQFDHPFQKGSRALA
jgi:hypothetical protein